MPVYLSPTYRVVNTINGTLSSGLADSLSNIYVAGSYGSSSAIMNQPSGPSSYSFPATLGGTAGSLIKLSPYGTVLSRTYIDGTGQDSDSFVNIDSQGNVYITGTYGGVAANVYYSNTSNVSNIIPSSNVYFPTTNQTCGFVVKTLSNGFPLWRTYVSPNSGAASSSITSTCTTTDSNSNVYMCGTIAVGSSLITQANVYYSNVLNVSNIIQSPIGFKGSMMYPGNNAFFTRLDSTGNVVGNGGIYNNGVNTVNANSLLVDTQSNIYLVGTFDSRGSQPIISNLSVNSGAALPSFTATANSAAYIVSYYGNCQYISYSCVSNLSSTVSASAGGSNIDSSSNLYICGSASSFCTFYGTNTALVTPGSVQNTAGYVVKCSPSFLFYFRVYVDGPGTEVCTSVATDPLYSNIFIGGTYGTSGATAYGASSGTLTLPPTSGNQGGYIIRYDNTGTPIWQVTLSGASGVSINSVTVDSSQTSYITGTYGPGSVILYDTLNSNTILPAQASTTGFSLKLDVNGAIVFTGFTGLGTLSGAITSVVATTTTITVSFSTTNTNTDDTVTIYQASTLNGTPTAFGATPVLASSGTITCSPTAGYYIFLVITSTLGGTYTSSAWQTPILYVQLTPKINLVLGTNINNTGSLSSQSAVSMPSANTPQFTTQSGKACLNTSNSVLYIPYGSTVPSSFTVCMWFYKTTTVLTDFFGIGNSSLTTAYFNTDSFTATRCTLALLSPNPTFDYTNSQWNHLAVVVSTWNTSPNVNIYLNGVAPPPTSTNIPYSGTGNFASWVGNANTFTIGTNGDAGTNSLGRSMGGYICKFQVYDQALTSAQISSIYLAG